MRNGMEIVKCLDRMWMAFVRSVDDVEKYETQIMEFVEAKDRAHELLSAEAKEDEEIQGRYVVHREERAPYCVN